MLSIFQTPIEQLRGIGEKKANLLKKEAQIFTFQDLLMYFPYKYVDKTQIFHISEIPANSQGYLQIRGKITHMSINGEHKNKRLVAIFQDETGFMELVWFHGITYMEKYLQLNEEYIVFGKPQLFNQTYSIIHPEITLPTDENRKQGINVRFQPFYNSTDKMKRAGLDSKHISKLCMQLLNDYGSYIKESLPNHLRENCRLMPKQQALMNIHFPQSNTLLAAAQYRLKFDEMFFLQLDLIQKKLIHSTKAQGFLFPKIGNHFHACYDRLPFDLTDAQKKVIKEIRNDLISGKQMNRLLQGDVGSGKTITALLIMLIAIDNGFQTCLMAPTEILAEQHFDGICKFLKDLDIKIELLTGSTKSSQRKKILESLVAGEIDILIGTHALIEENVVFKSLGLAVIDEQHRFGVEQRAKLWKKNSPAPHVLIMTATPIPRTLAMTVYGDLNLSIIDEVPKNRKPIITRHFHQSEWPRVVPFLKKQISEGRQIFVVFPLIQESETLDLQNLMEGYENFQIDFPAPQYSISYVHGQMSSAEKNREMERFASGKTQLLLATSVIEVGIDIPNANVMIIENSERFGLSQLHQLRGRVGRGSAQSYCILLTGDKLSNDGRHRIQAMVNTTNGFELADFDLKMRGPGDMAGTRQSGMLEFKLVDLVKDEKLISYCRQLAQQLLKEDPDLQKEKHAEIRRYLFENPPQKFDYMQIS